MSDMSDISAALHDGLRAVYSLETWVTNADGRDIVRHRERSIKQGIEAYERLSRQLREGRKYIEPPDDWKRTSCGCQDPGASPPCSWCTDPENDPDKKEIDDEN